MYGLYTHENVDIDGWPLTFTVRDYFYPITFKYSAHWYVTESPNFVLPLSTLAIL